MIKHNDEDDQDRFEQDISDHSQEEEAEDSHQSLKNQNKITSDFFQIHGMFFCLTCKNLMDPYKTKADILEFKCRRCGPKPISFIGRKDQKSMLMSKSLQASSRKVELESKSIFDRSMPIMTIECPGCSYDEAVYTVVPEEGQRRIMVKLICARGADEGIVKCGTKWDLEQETEIDEAEFEGALQVKEELIEEEDE